MRSTPPWQLLATAALALSALVAACAGSQASPDGAGEDVEANGVVTAAAHIHSTVSPSSTSRQAPVGLATPGPYSTRIEDAAFEFHIAVIAGSTVTWTNTDGTPHTVTADDGSFDSGPLQPGRSFTLSFDEAGVWNYACAIHPQMRGLVHVEADTKSDG